jgi:toxin ParE1/3/4
MRLTYHPDAEAELLEATRFYARRSAEVSDRFVREFDAGIASIREAPERWPVIEDGVRRYVMRRFPYGIYYRIAGDGFTILVIKHHSRHPD